MRLYPKDFIKNVRWINHSHSQGTQDDDVDVPDRGSSDLYSQGITLSGKTKRYSLRNTLAYK